MIPGAADKDHEANEPTAPTSPSLPHYRARLKRVPLPPHCPPQPCHLDCQPQCLWLPQPVPL